ncbi:hypothetical protein [Sphaerospermopsis aphanizomenoides]|jgi:hypothetical protein|nr:hypothetical protein [Sphaerospermopsis aphanizomenoides]
MMEIFVETHQRIKDCKSKMIIVVFRRLLLLASELILRRFLMENVSRI